ncbi:MAG: peroxiredoxin family protein [Steroidobacteraceae bacterium]
MRTHSSILSAFLLILVTTAMQAHAADAASWVPPGPAIGQSFPDALTLPDHGGKSQSLKALRGKNGIALLFVRSADWCPFCKAQLVDVNKHLADFQQLGFNVVSVSMDTVDKIAGFHGERQIGFTMLSDPKGDAVERLGIRDLQYADGSKAFGVARPMIFILDATLTIRHKYAEESYRNRPDLGKVLADLRAAPHP